jgi:hypothetical protein
MQALGNFLVGHYPHNDRSVYGVRATVLARRLGVHPRADHGLRRGNQRRPDPAAAALGTAAAAHRGRPQPSWRRKPAKPAAEEQQVITYDDRPAGTRTAHHDAADPEEIIPPAEPTPRGVDVDGPKG